MVSKFSNYAIPIITSILMQTICKIVIQKLSKVIIKWGTLSLLPLFPKVTLNTSSDTSCGVLVSDPKGLGKEECPRGVSNPISGCELGKILLSKYTAPKDVIQLSIAAHSPLQKNDTQFLFGTEIMRRMFS